MIGKIKDFFINLFGGAGVIIMYGFFLLIPIGDLYWLWMSIHIGSFLMFVMGLFPLTALIVAPVGAYSLIFGVPEWVFNFFG
jgi:ABC-type multidrug transport system permease subunit